MASSPLEAATQRSTHGCWVSISRKPQWTTSWSSTTSTRRRLALRLSTRGVRSGIVGHQQAQLPAVGGEGPELEKTAGLKRLEGREPEPHPRRSAVAGLLDAVVCHLEQKGAAGACGPDA